LPYGRTSEQKLFLKFGRRNCEDRQEEKNSCASITIKSYITLIVNIFSELKTKQEQALLPAQVNF
jgi:hypothetical protein